MRNDAGESVRVTVSGPRLAVETCVGRLAQFATDKPTTFVIGEGASVMLPWNGDGAPPDRPIACRVSWHPAAAACRSDSPATESTIQALSGLMYLHGRDHGAPRRLGIEVGSVAAGVLASHAVLASVIGAHHRSQDIPTIDTSVLQAALVLVSHYVAAATCGEEWVPAPPGPSPGPPFATVDGRWFEIETLDPEAWRSFWLKLGADGADLGWGWTLFRSRYYRGTCTLPTGFHEVTSLRTIAEVTDTAKAYGVSLSPVRDYADVLDDFDAGIAHPVIQVLHDERRHPGVAARDATRLTESHGGDGVLPLAGLRVIEATNRMQGPLAGLLLRWLGAEVVKVEPPGGDIGRGVPPFAGDTGSFFLCFNRGKETVELDLGTAAGRAELADLVADADVFLHNWRPGKAREWSLAPADLAPRSPRLIYADPSGWGEGRNRPTLVGTDFLVQAYSGLAHGLTPVDEPPSPSRVLLTDCLGALVACEAVLGGLLRREQTGRGCRVETSLLAGAMTLQTHVIEAIASGREEGRREGRPVWGLLDVPVPAADGFVAVGIEDAAALHSLCTACGIEPGVESREVCEQSVAVQLATQDTRWCEEQLAEAGIPCAAVNTDLAALPADPRFGTLFEPLAANASSLAPASPWSFSAKDPGDAA